MNWQLLIKIVSSSLLHPRSRGCSLSPGDRRRRLFRLTNLTKQGGGWRFFEGRGQHSFCSCQLFIMGDTSRDRRESCPPLFLLPREKKGRDRPISSSSCPGDFLMWDYLRILVAPGRRICPRVTAHRARCEGDFNLSFQAEMTMMIRHHRTKQNSRVKFTSFSDQLLNYAAIGQLLANLKAKCLLTFDHLALGSTLSIFLERIEDGKVLYSKHN